MKKLITIAIMALSINAFAQSNNFGFIKGLISYPGDGIPSDYIIKAVNISTGKVFSTKKYDLNTLIYSLKVDTGSYYIYAKTDPGDPDYPFKAYYSEWVKCGEKAECLSHKILILKVVPNQTIKNINLTDCYNEDWTSEEKELSSVSKPEAVAFSYTATSQTVEKFTENWQIGFREKATKKIIIQPKYSHAEDFIGGITTVSVTPLASPNMAVKTKWKIIDSKGNYISPDEFDKVEIKKNGIALVYKLKDKNEGGRYSYDDTYMVGVIKKDGTYLFPCEYDKIGEMADGYLRIYSAEKGVGVMDKDWKVTIASQNEYMIEEYVGCGLFLYINPGGKRNGNNDPMAGGLVDAKLHIWINQDSVDFVPSTIINPSSCTNKNALFGLTKKPRSGSAGIYRIGFGLVVPVDTYNFEKDSRGNQSFKYVIKPNVIEIMNESFENRYSNDKLIAKYDWKGKLIYSKKK